MSAYNFNNFIFDSIYIVENEKSYCRPPMQVSQIPGQILLAYKGTFFFSPLVSHATMYYGVLKVKHSCAFYCMITVTALPVKSQMINLWKMNRNKLISLAGSRC